MFFRSIILSSIFPLYVMSFIVRNHRNPKTQMKVGDTMKTATLTMAVTMSSVEEETATTTAATTTMTPGAKIWKEPLVVSEMPPPLPDNLKNTYYLLRHGQSTANVASVISSSRSLAYSDRHGVTSLGYQQGKESSKQLVNLLKEESKKGEKVIFISSPFARARQTAQACIDGLFDKDFDPETSATLQDLNLDVYANIELDERLMERYFGRLDDEAIYTYAYVWPLDGFNVTHTAFDVESVAAVCARLNQLVADLEQQYENHHIVWVSHADVLQIAQLYGANAPNVGKFSSYRFTNGEVRVMKRTPDTLPDPNPLDAPLRGTSRMSPTLPAAAATTS